MYVSDVRDDICGYRIDIKHNENDSKAVSLVLQKKNNAHTIRHVIESDNANVDVSAGFIKMRAKWLIRDSEDGYEHHYCAACSKKALFEYVYEDMWDENVDGEMENCGPIEVDINEHITPFCPHCGAEMENCNEN